MPEQDTVLYSFLQDCGTVAASKVHDAALLNGRQASKRFGYLPLGRLLLYGTRTMLTTHMLSSSPCLSKTTTRTGSGLQWRADGHAAMAVWGVPGRLPDHQLVLATAPLGGVCHSGAPGHRRSAGNT